MLAEEFCLLLEALRERDAEQHVRSTSPHVPVVLPTPVLQSAKARSAA